ncbi:hypothetical protein [Pyruvatibacter mobilis]|uniref:hypothetical protein n=1 Tax=Pyruvatibacter mobilis TaxID=1712261 RepID=UPI003D0A1498
MSDTEPSSAGSVFLFTKPAAIGGGAFSVSMLFYIFGSNMVLDELALFAAHLSAFALPGWVLCLTLQEEIQIFTSNSRNRTLHIALFILTPIPLLSSVSSLLCIIWSYSPSVANTLGLSIVLFIVVFGIMIVFIKE